MQKARSFNYDAYIFLYALICKLFCLHAYVNSW